MRWTDRLIGLSAFVGTAGLLFVVGVILVDVTGRNFGRPLYGAQDMVTMTMVLIVFGGMALCDRLDGHIVVDIFEGSFPEWLNRAIDIKRNSNGIVDAISAEDIGKFPDTNLAESLQRITGVSIDRSNGEGSFVTVRGFGPDFSTTLLNGREQVTTGVGSGCGGGGTSGWGGSGGGAGGSGV